MEDHKNNNHHQGENERHSEKEELLEEKCVCECDNCQPNGDKCKCECEECHCTGQPKEHCCD